MKNLLLTFLLTITTGTIYSMDNAMILRTEHAQRVAALKTQIEEKEQRIQRKRLWQAQEVANVHRRWDVKDAITPLVFTVLIGGKMAYDIYSIVNITEVPAWLNITELALDGAVGGFCLAKGTYHLMRACCCRKPQNPIQS